MLEHLDLLYLLTHYGYLALAGVLAMGVLGLPIPDEIILIFCGYLVFCGKLKVIPVISAAFIGSTLGITVTYLLGYFAGRPVVSSWGKKVGITEERLKIVHKWFKKFGKLAIPICYFFPLVRSVTAFFAAISMMSYIEFALYAYPAGLLWSALYISIGWYLGKDWVLAKSFIRHFHDIGLDICILVIGLIIWLLWRSNKEKQ